MVRLFIGIKIEPSQQLLDLQSDLKKILHPGKINWVDPGNLHITLYFLGEVDEILVDPLVTILNRIASGSHTLTLDNDCLGFFGSRRHPSVIWFAYKKQEELLKLKTAIDRALIELGFQPDRKEFHPHITVARVKRMENFNSFLDYINLKNPQIRGEQIVKEFQLIRSILHPEGPVYKILHNFRLKE